MGYENRFYIVEKKPNLGKDEIIKPYWGKVIMIFNMGKLSGFEDLVKKYPVTNCFIYDDHDNMILEDSYGDPLREIPIKEVINEIYELIKMGITDYKVKSFVQVLSTINYSIDASQRSIICLHYGY